MNSRIAAAFAGLALLGLAACATPSVYAPQTSAGSEGYADRQLASNRFRVSFHGNSVTSREMVEDYLLRRAAEVPLPDRFHGLAGLGRLRRLVLAQLGFRCDRGHAAHHQLQRLCRDHDPEGRGRAAPTDRAQRTGCAQSPGSVAATAEVT